MRACIPTAVIQQPQGMVNGMFANLPHYGREKRIRTPDPRLSTRVFRQAELFSDLASALWNVQEIKQKMALQPIIGDRGRCQNRQGCLSLSYEPDPPL